MTQTQPTQGTTAIARADDGDLVRRALARDSSAFRTIMQTYNRRLYRLARSILRDDAEAEDAVQESYVRRSPTAEFPRRIDLGTWLSRIAINEALGRLRTRRVTVDITRSKPRNGRRDHSVSSHLESDDPERTMRSAKSCNCREGHRQSAGGLPTVSSRVSSRA